MYTILSYYNTLLAVCIINAAVVCRKTRLQYPNYICAKNRAKYAIEEQTKWYSS